MDKNSLTFYLPLKANYTPESKHRTFGFCYKGPSVLSARVLEKATIIKEAYGVEDNGVNYVCIVLFTKNQRRLATAGDIPYACGLLPATLRAENVSGCRHQLSVYKADTPSDDAVLAMLKKPSENKWRWRSRARFSS